MSSNPADPHSSSAVTPEPFKEPGRQSIRAPGIADARVEQLRACPLFSVVPIDEIFELARYFEPVSVAPGQVIIQEGASDPFLYVVTAGRLEVFAGGTGDKEATFLATVYPGEPIGEMAYFGDRRRSASVRALQESDLLRIDFSDLSECFERVPLVAAAFLSVVTQRLRQNNQLYQENHYRLRSAERSLKDLSEFLDLSDVNSLGTGIEGLIKRLVHTASSLLDADRASLFLIDDVTGELWSKVAEGSEVKEIRVPAGAGVVGWVATNKRLVNIHEAYDDDRFNPAVDKATGYRTRTILAAPVWSLENRVIGVVQVINKSTGIFTEEDESLFRAFAHQAAVAVENFNLYRKMVLSHRKMAIMLDITRAISETLSLGELIGIVVRKTSEIMQCDRSSYFVYDRNAGELWSMEAQGADFKEIRFSISAGIAGYAAMHGQVVNVADAYDDPRFNRAFDVKTGYRTRSVLCVPVRDRDGSVIGVIQAINRLDGTFDEDDVDLLGAISSQLGVATQNAQLHADTVRVQRYLQSVQESISSGIVTLDDSYCIQMTNTMAKTILNAEVEDLVGSDLRVVLGHRNRAVAELVDRAYAGGASISEYDVSLSVGSEEDSSINIHITPLHDAESAFQGLVIVIEDVTSEKRVKNTLTRYMAKDIVERMLQDPSQQNLGGVRSTATVLFSDIRGFTSIAEALTAEATMDLLNEYFSLMVEEVFKQKGVLDKFMGDALMAVYGIPYPQSDDAIRAVRTALNMREALDGFNRDRVGRGLLPIKIGIGINTDEVISGNMGSKRRMDYTVIGDGVNISSRLESLNKQYGTEILLSQSTRALIGDEFALRPLDLVVTKGKSYPVQIYEALGPASLDLPATVTNYAKSLALYRSGDFAAALEGFAKHEAEDGPSRTMAERCREFLDNGAPSAWDGAWRALEK
jgi:adenylate cyclase